jgi:acetyl-CoA carboxylase biotin carboxyl carrier protein
MDVRLIQRLVQIMRSAEVSELELDDQKAGLHLRLKRGPEPPAAPAQLLPFPAAAAPSMLVAPAGAASPAPPAPAAAAAAAVPTAPARGEPFPSPMVGTFYRAASPEAEPFVQIGSSVRPDTTLCIIEAMKVMNEIKAETSGTVAEILVENGAAVEFGQALFLLRKG